MKGFLFVFAAALLLVVPASGQAPSGGSVRPTVEYDFTPPAGWKNTVKDPGYMMVNPSETIYLLIRQHSKNDYADAVRETEIDDTYRVVGKPQEIKNGGKTFRVTKTTTNGGTGVVDVFVLLSSKGGGVIVMALSSPATAAAAFEAGLSLAESVTFPGAPAAIQPQTPRATAAATPSASGWSGRLANKHLLFLFSGNGYFEEKHIYLCSTGNFIQTTGSGGYTPGNSDGGSFGAKGGRRGQWAVSGSVLLLQFQDGAVVRYNITPRQNSNEVGLNGKRFFLDGNAGC